MFAPACRQRPSSSLRTSPSPNGSPLTIREQLAEALDGKVILMPTVPVTAPTPEEARTPDVRGRLLSLTVLAPIGRLPGLTVPVDGPGGLPVGLCLVGAQGSDEQLLSLAASL